MVHRFVFAFTLLLAFLVTSNAQAHDPGVVADVPSATEPSPSANSTVGSTGRTTPNYGLLIVGGTTVFVAYGIPLGISLLYFALIWPFQAAFSGNLKPPEPILWLMVPVAGPFAVPRTEFGQNNRNLTPWFYADGILQGVGIGLVLAGLVIRKKATFTAEESARWQWDVLPVASGRPGMTFRLGF